MTAGACNRVTPPIIILTLQVQLCKCDDGNIQSSQRSNYYPSTVHISMQLSHRSFNCATTIIMHPAIPAPDDQLPIVAFPERHQMVRYIKSTVGTLLPSSTHPSLYIVFHQVKTKCLLKTPHPLPYSSLLMNTNDTPSPLPPASPSSSFNFFNLNLKHISSYHKQHFVALLKYIIHKDLIDIYQ